MARRPFAGTADAYVIDGLGRPLPGRDDVGNVLVAGTARSISSISLSSRTRRSRYSSTSTWKRRGVARSRHRADSS